MSNESIYTLAVHAGEDREANHGALSIPIYNASVYAFTDAEDGAAIHNEFKHGYYYGRLGNPTTEALERTIAELESAPETILSLRNPCTQRQQISSIIWPTA